MFSSVSLAVWRALLVSALLHVGLFFALSGSDDRDDSDAVITIGVEYQAGRSTEAAKRENAKRSQVNDGSSALPNSARSDSTQAADGIDGEAIGLKVHYPRLSRTLGESGRVQIAVRGADHVSAASERVSVRVSSGFKRLDESAQRTIEVALNNGSLQRFLKEQELLLINFVFRLK